MRKQLPEQRIAFGIGELVQELAHRVFPAQLALVDQSGDRGRCGPLPRRGDVQHRVWGRNAEIRLVQDLGAAADYQPYTVEVTMIDAILQARIQPREIRSLGAGKSPANPWTKERQRAHGRESASVHRSSARPACICYR
jgi:hypothetical protein